jgi:hypothetical protein
MLTLKVLLTTFVSTVALAQINGGGINNPGHGGGGSGTVTNVSCSSVFGVNWLTCTFANGTSTPVLQLTPNTQSANLFAATPNGSSGPVALRAITSADILGLTSTNNCVTNFGADPTGATNATTALQNCINSLAPGGTNEAGFVIIPPAKGPNFFYQCFGPLSWGSTISGMIWIQTGAALLGCSLPTVSPGAPQWIKDDTTATIIGYNGLELPGTTSYISQNYLVCTASNICTSISAGSLGALQFSRPTSLALSTISGTYGSSQVAAIGSSGSPIAFYTTPTNPALQNYEVCSLLVAENTIADAGNVQFHLEWTDVASNSEVSLGPLVALGTKSVNGGSCLPITPLAGSSISWYVTYTATGSSQYGLTGSIKLQ